MFCITVSDGNVLKLNAISREPAPLPLDRVVDCVTFEIMGINLAGPLFLKSGEKVWTALFTCANFRSSHLELVNSLTADSFLLSLRRFIARRGRPRTIYSDNGTNFRYASQWRNGEFSGPPAKSDFEP
ncbi:integrase catalytic domain-containing protein [Trichonephila clavipes]|nr:integrase catalytic domain-containing protein [Trichonephila clavipes]